MQNPPTASTGKHRFVRKIVRIDEDKCNGCGECVPSCAEGAIRIIEGKARLIADKLCDGLGACLGHCPMGAISIEERPAEGFDESAVREHASTPSRPEAMLHPQAGGCPGSRMRMVRRPAAPAATSAAGAPSRASQLRQWPVQLALVPTSGPLWQDADVLIAADCVPLAVADFHEQMLAGKSVAIACPKLDDVRPYIQKLATIFAVNEIRSITVAHMEVPCCGGIVRAVEMALAQAGRDSISMRVITVAIDGTILSA